MNKMRIHSCTINRYGGGVSGPKVSVEINRQNSPVQSMNKLRL